jgi:acetolactate synthase-1/2/3 large subunit
MSEPRGPVYMTLPRELLAEPAVHARRDTSRPLGVPPASPSLQAIEEAAAILAKAEFPLIITSSAGRNPDCVGLLATLANDFALPVVQNETRDLNLQTNHPMHVGYDSSAWLGQADAVLVLDCVVPWIPKTVLPKAGAKIIHASSDPLAARFPFREIETDVLVGGDTRAILTMLHAALREAMKGKQSAIESRRKTISAAHDDQQIKRKQLVEKVKSQTPIHPVWLAACVNEAMAKDAIIVSELGLMAGHLDLNYPSSYMGGLLSGGLGFGLGAGLGAKIAAPKREVIISCGDGSYMFGNPLPFHYVARSENLPVLSIIHNNSSWHAVRRSTLDVYPEGVAAKANTMALTDLKPSPDFEKMADTCGGYGEKVEDPAELPKALKRALDKVRSGTPALLNVITVPGR